MIAEMSAININVPIVPSPGAPAEESDKYVKLSGSPQYPQSRQMVLSLHPSQG